VFLRSANRPLWLCTGWRLCLQAQPPQPQMNPPECLVRLVAVTATPLSVSRYFIPLHAPQAHLHPVLLFCISARTFVLGLACCDYQCVGHAQQLGFHVLHCTVAISCCNWGLCVCL
jgi:hypothetical protein